MQGGGAQQALGALRHLPQGELETAPESLRVDHQDGVRARAQGKLLLGLVLQSAAVLVIDEGCWGQSY